MAAIARYLTHPQVEIDPSIPVTAWGLNSLGHQRVRSVVTAGWLSRISRIVCSAERKAIETATPIAKALGIPIEVRKGMHENDRSSTGFLPPVEFEKVATEFFGYPQTSVRGWETALAAQARIVREVEEVLDGPTSGDLLLVGHGAVGTLLLCHYAQLAINRAHDQPSGGGQCFAFSLRDRRLIHSWMPMEDLVLKCTASDNLC